jgi:transcriptional regulator GlxA family with amidase domain
MSDNRHKPPASDAAPHGRNARGALTHWQLRAALSCLSGQAPLRLAVREATRVCGVSREHFSRAFKIATGMSPTRWHLEQRLNRAQTLIAGNELSLAAIAAHCGFADQSHLSNTFKRLRQQSPGAYRRSLAVQSDGDDHIA